MASGASHRRQLVHELGIADPCVRDAFLAVPRERFVPGFHAEHGLAAVYADEVIVTKTDEHGRAVSSSSQPAIMAAMLERLALEPGQRVLEIGAGTGWNAALLKAIVGPRGRVVSIDVDPELARSARRALVGYGVRVVCGDGRLGWPRGAPYDRVIATVSTGEVPRAWRDQLVEGGLLELPLRLRLEEQVVATFRREGDRLRWVTGVPGGFMPLRGTQPEPGPALHAGFDRAPLVQLRGPALAALSDAARRRLLAVALERPRSVAIPAAPRWDLRLRLALSLPDSRLVESPEGIGIAARDGRSLALLDCGWRPGVAETTRRLLCRGGDEAERYLLRAVEAWRRRGSPGADRLDLTIEFGPDGSRLA